MKIISEEIIEIDGFKYKQTTYDNGTVVKEAYSDSPIPEPENSVSMEDIQAELLLNQVEILMNQSTQDSVLSEILLNQIEVM